MQALADTWPNLDGFNALGWYDDVDPTKVRLKSLSDGHWRAKGYFPSEKGNSSNIILSRGKRTPTRPAFANLWYGREHFVQRLYFYMFRSL